MNRFLSIFALLFSIILPNNSIAVDDTLSPKEIHEYYLNSSTRDALLVYFKGIGNGFLWTNAYLESTGKKQLYCAPGKKQFNSEDLYAFFRSEYLEKKELYDNVNMQPQAFILLQALRKRDPCK